MQLRATAAEFSNMLEASERGDRPTYQRKTLRSMQEDKRAVHIQQPINRKVSCSQFHQGFLTIVQEDPRL